MKEDNMKKMLVVILVVFSVLLLNGATVNKSLIQNYATSDDNSATVQKSDNSMSGSTDLEKQADPFYGDPFIRNEDSGGD
jgi:hypothetical protein